MSIATSTAKVQYTLASTVQALPIPFYFLENGHIKAIRARSGVADYVMILGTDYTLAGAGDEDGGTLTTTATNMQAGDVVTIKRNIAITQTVNYVYNDRFPAETHERALDKLTMIVQQLKEVTDRSVQFPESEVAGTGNIMPAASGRAAKILGFDASGNAVQLYDPVSAVFSEGDAIYANSVAALKAVSVTSLLNGQQCHVGGYASVGDGGGGTWVYVSASAATETVGTIVAPNSGSGRWLRVYSGPVNAKWFGAKGDGLTDDYASIAAALAAADAVYLPAGSYKIGTRISLASNKRLLGEHKTTTILVANTGANACLRIAGNDVFVENLTVKGNTTDHAAVGAAEIGIDTNSDVIFSLRNVLISEFKYYGLKIAQAQRVMLDYVNIYHVYNAGGTGIALSMATVSGGDYCNGLIAVGGEIHASDIGVAVGQCASVKFDGVIIEGCYVNAVKFVTGKICDTVTFDNCYFELDGTAATDYPIQSDTDFTSGPTFSNVAFRGCHFHEPSNADRPLRSDIIGRFRSFFNLRFEDCYHTSGNDANPYTSGFRIILGRRCTNTVVTNCDTFRFENENGEVVGNAPAELEENLWAASSYLAGSWTLTNLTQGAVTNDEATFLDGKVPIKFTVANNTDATTFFAALATAIDYTTLRGGLIGIRFWVKVAAGAVKIVPQITGAEHYFLPSGQLQSSPFVVGTEWKEIVMVISTKSDESAGFTLGFRGFKFGTVEPGTLYLARPQIFRNFLTPPGYVDTQNKAILIPGRQKVVFGAAGVPAQGVFMRGDIVRATDATAAGTGLTICTAEGAKKLETRVNSKAYKKGAIIAPGTGRPSICAVAGTVAGSEPSWAGKGPGAAVADGTAVWLVLCDNEATLTALTLD